MQMIDLAPTWGEFGLVYARLAESGEVNAVRAMRSDLARAFAAAQALSALTASCDVVLTNEQMDIVSRTLVTELRKQGVTQPAPVPPGPNRRTGGVPGVLPTWKEDGVAS